MSWWQDVCSSLGEVWWWSAPAPILDQLLRPWSRYWRTLVTGLRSRHSPSLVTLETRGDTHHQNTIWRVKRTQTIISGVSSIISRVFCQQGFSLDFIDISLIRKWKVLKRRMSWSWPSEFSLQMCHISSASICLCLTIKESVKSPLK